MKIYWYGFKRQLNEFYLLLRGENFISCDVDEFFSHFTGKKLAIEEDYSSKIKWHAAEGSLKTIIDHMSEKRFLQGTDTTVKAFKTHFHINSGSGKVSRKALQNKLDILFPATSGYRCKERLFYKARNKEYNIKEVVGNI